MKTKPPAAGSAAVVVAAPPAEPFGSATSWFLMR